MIKALQKKDHGKATFIKSQLLYFSMEHNNVLCVFDLPLLVKQVFMCKSLVPFSTFHKILQHHNQR